MPGCQPWTSPSVTGTSTLRLPCCRVPQGVWWSLLHWPCISCWLQFIIPVQLFSLWLFWVFDNLSLREHASLAGHLHGKHGSRSDWNATTCAMLVRSNNHATLLVLHNNIRPASNSDVGEEVVIALFMTDGGATTPSFSVSKQSSMYAPLYRVPLICSSAQYIYYHACVTSCIAVGKLGNFMMTNNFREYKSWRKHVLACNSLSHTNWTEQHHVNNSKAQTSDILK